MNESILKDIGRSYIVSSLLPASIFVVLAVLIFEGFVPPETKRQLLSSTVPFGSFVASIILFSVWLGFVLYSSQNFVVQFFEGYNLPGLLKNLLLQIKRWQHGKKLDQIQLYLQDYSELRYQLHIAKQKDKKGILEQLRVLYPQAYNAIQALDFSMPLDKDLLLPTRLGNILRASEYYPNERYRFDGVNIWARLIKVVPKEFGANLEERNNQFMFLLNSSLLIGFLACFSLLTAILVFVISIHERNCLRALSSSAWICPSFLLDFSSKWISVVPWHIAIGAILLLVCYLLYSFSLGAAKDFSSYIRSGFDLYRHELLKQLKLSLPQNFKAEQRIWKQIDEFYIAGEAFNEVNFQYETGENAEVEKGKLRFKLDYAFIGGASIALPVLLRLICNQRDRR